MAAIIQQADAIPKQQQFTPLQALAPALILEQALNQLAPPEENARTTHTVDTSTVIVCGQA